METLRHASFLAGDKEILSREVFSAYQEEIVRAVREGSAPGVVLDRRKDRLIITPYRAVLGDLSSDVTVVVNGEELPKAKTLDGVSVVLKPGENQLVFDLTTSYLKDQRVLSLEANESSGREIHVQSGFRFRTLKVRTEDPEAMLRINGHEYQALTKGTTVIKNVPGVPLTLQSVSLAGPDKVSPVVPLDPQAKEVRLALQRQSAGGASSVPTPPTPATSLPHRPVVLQRTPLEALSTFAKAWSQDMSTGYYKTLTALVEPGSPLDRELREEVVSAGGTAHTLLNLLDTRTTQLTGTSGYVDATFEFKTERQKDPKPQQIRYRHYYTVTGGGQVLLVRREKLST